MNLLSFQVSILLVPTCYCLLMTLTIRGCMSPGGTDGIMRYLAPDWKHITQPWVWLEAAKVVFISMQLGMGVISTYASFNKYHHNIIRYVWWLIWHLIHQDDALTSAQTCNLLHLQTGMWANSVCRYFARLRSLKNAVLFSKVPKIIFWGGGCVGAGAFLENI